MRFDTHAHIFHKDIGIANARYIPNYEVRLEDFISHLQSNGLSGGALIQPSFLGYDNSLLLDSIKRDKRLKGVVVLPFDTSFDTLKSYKDIGVVGIRLNLIGKDINELIESLRSNEGVAFLNSLKMLNLHVEIHREMHDLYKVIESLRPFDLDIVIDHLGRPKGDLIGLDELMQCAGKLWFKVSGFYRFGGNRSENIDIAKVVYTKLKEAFGVEQFVFGSDYPHTNFEGSMDYKQSFETFFHIVSDSKEQEIILGENAKKLFGFM